MVLVKMIHMKYGAIFRIENHISACFDCVFRHSEENAVVEILWCNGGRLVRGCAGCAGAAYMMHDVKDY